MPDPTDAKPAPSVSPSTPPATDAPLRTLVERYLAARDARREQQAVERQLRGQLLLHMLQANLTEIPLNDRGEKLQRRSKTFVRVRKLRPGEL
ncbi:hypothetical protein [Bremerella cremea]|uniref:hypothetical protein n=1 Tax=Bremerella cremea TaxID=1031537 RepID=UPI0031EE6F85